MKCFLINNNCWTDIDLFGKKPELYYKGNSKESSLVSIICTIIYLIIYAAFLVYKLIRAYKRIDVTFYDTYAYKDIPSIKLTNEEFYGGFALGGIVDETIYNIKVQHVSGVKVSGVWNYTYTDLEIEICKLEKFGTKYRKFFKDKPLDNLYCLKNVNFTLEGYTYLERYSYINLKVYPCVNHTKDGRPCKDYNTILNFFEKNTMEFKVQDNLLTPEIYKNPVEPMEKEIPCPVFLRMYQEIYSYFQIIFVETNEDITGLNYWAKPKVEKYTKYLDSFIISAPGTTDILKIGGPVCDVTMQLAATVLSQRRTYPSIIDILGEVGGFMEILYTFFKIISSFIIDMLYHKSLINNLFSFDIDRKLILIEKREYKKCEYLKDFEKMDSSFTLNEINQEKKYNCISDDKINKGKIENSKINNSLDFEQKDNQYKKVGEKLYSSLYLKSSSRYSINKIKTKERNDVLKKIINQCCICFYDKKRNLKKILIKECNKLIRSKLDIVNLFINSMIDERNLKNLSKEELCIKMSEECSTFIKDFNKGYNNT